LAEKVETLATPIKDFLSSIFFTAVGEGLALYQQCSSQHTTP